LGDKEIAAQPAIIALETNAAMHFGALSAAMIRTTDR